MRLIDADEFYKMLQNYRPYVDGGLFNAIQLEVQQVIDCLEEELNDAPTIDAVSKGVVEQFRWERDVAMAQLEEYGIPFGTNKDEDVVRVVRCKDCRWYDNKYGDVCHNPRYGDGHANYSPPYVDENYWCKDGERKGGEEE